MCLLCFAIRNSCVLSAGYLIYFKHCCPVSNDGKSINSIPSHESTIKYEKKKKLKIWRHQIKTIGIVKAMPGFRFTAFGHFIGLIAYFPCQNCRRFHHYCNNYCWQIAATLKDVHFHCTAYLDWYFRCHDHLMVAWLLHLRLLNMVNLIFYCAYRCPCLHLVFFCFVVQINILL